MDGCGQKRARADGDCRKPTIIIVDGGNGGNGCESWEPPAVWSVMWEQSPFVGAPIPQDFKQFWIVMTGQTDPEDYGSDEECVDGNFTNEDGVQCWSIRSLCKDLGVKDAAADVHKWLLRKEFASIGNALLHPKIAGRLCSANAVMTLFMSPEE